MSYRNETQELVFCILRLKGVKFDNVMVKRIMDKFSHDELIRIHRLVKERRLNG